MVDEAPLAAPEGGEAPPVTETFPAPEGGEAPPAPEGKKPEGEAATLAAGGGTPEGEAPPVPQDFPDNWRDLVAGESKKDRKALDRFNSPSALYESWKNANDKLRSGKLLEVPGDDADDEARAAFNKALGVPEKPEEYFDKLSLSDGKVLGDADRETFNSFAAEMHKAGAPPAVVNAAVDWQLRMQQAQVEQMAEADAEFRAESENALRREMGGDFKRQTNAIAGLFTEAPDVMDLVLNARADGGRGHPLGDYPVFVRFLSRLALDMNPVAEMDAGDDAANMKALSDEIAELRKLSTDQTSEYWKGPRAKEHQARYAKLLEIRGRAQGRAA